MRQQVSASLRWTCTAQAKAHLLSRSTGCRTRTTSLTVMRRQPEKKKNVLQGSTAAPTMRLRAGHASPVPCRPNSTNGPQPSTRAEQVGWMQLRAMQEMLWRGRHQLFQHALLLRL
jgi:hypothetical protein